MGESGIPRPDDGGLQCHSPRFTALVTGFIISRPLNTGGLT
jgi:hypothetical protein